eukprot:gene2588-2999_t
MEAAEMEEGIIKEYFYNGFQYKQILSMLSNNHDIKMSLSGLKRRIKRLGLARKKCNYDVEEIKRDIREILDGPGSSSGYRSVRHQLRMKGKIVPRLIVERLPSENSAKPNGGSPTMEAGVSLGEEPSSGKIWKMDSHRITEQDSNKYSSDEDFIVVSKYNPCSSDCHLTGKKHYHCKYCKYSTHKTDRFQKHISSHKLPAKVTDDIKHTCKKYFTAFKSDSHSGDCICEIPHVHCNICLHWVCPVKKGYDRQYKHLQNNHKENIESFVTGNDSIPTTSNLPIDTSKTKYQHHLSPQHVTTKKAKPNTPVQSKTPYLICASTAVDSPTARVHRDKHADTSNSEFEIDDWADNNNATRRRTLFHTGNEPEAETSNDDIGITALEDESKANNTIEQCVVCGTVDNVSKLQILEKGSSSKMNLIKLLSLLSFYRIKSKKLDNISICKKDRKVFFNYFDYYLKDIEASIVQSDEGKSQVNVSASAEITKVATVNQKNVESIRSRICEVVKTQIDEACLPKNILTVKSIINSGKTGESREPNALELISFALGKILSPTFVDYSDDKTAKRQCFKVDEFKILEECNSLPTPITLFDITLLGGNAISSREEAFKFLQINNIRQSLFSRYSWSPLKEMMTDEISNFQSSDLFYVMNKSGITYSYSEDEKTHEKCKEKLDKERSSILLNIPSNCHLNQIDNLETHMHYVLMLSTNEKLLHFMTQQVVYIDNFVPNIDFFQSQPSFLLEEKSFACEEVETGLINKFSEKLVQYVKNTSQILQEKDGVEEFINALSANETQSDKATEPKIEISKMPRKRVLDEHFQGNLSGDHNHTSEKLYYRIDALSSTNMFDTKTLVEKTMDEYQLFKLGYIEQSEYHPMTPFLFIESHGPISNQNLTDFQYYRNIYGLEHHPPTDEKAQEIENHAGIYISDSELMRRTDNRANIVAWISDMMFTFRTLKASKGVTYGKMCKTKAMQTVKPITKNEHWQQGVVASVRLAI